MRLDQYAKDFKSLIERLQLMKAFENAEEGSRLVAPSVLAHRFLNSDLLGICLCCYVASHCTTAHFYLYRCFSMSEILVLLSAAACLWIKFCRIKSFCYLRDLS